MKRLIVCAVLVFATLSLAGQRTNVHERAWDRQGVGISLGSFSNFPDDITERTAKRWFYDALEEEDVPFVSEDETEERGADLQPTYFVSFYYSKADGESPSGYRDMGIIRVHLSLLEFADLHRLNGPVLVESWTAPYAILCRPGDEATRLRMFMEIMAAMIKSKDPDDPSSRMTSLEATAALEEAAHASGL